MSEVEPKKGAEELTIDTSTFDALEKDFQDVLQMLVGDTSLDKFRLEFEKLHRALKKSHDEEKRLISKCRELNTEIVNNAAKVQTALKLSQDDQNTISNLKKEIQKAWKMVDASHEKELRAKETISQLKTEITRLSQLVEEGAGLSIGQENAVKELIKVKEDLTSQLSETKEINDDLVKQVELLKNKLETRRITTKELEEKLENQKVELDESRKREKREHDLNDKLDHDLRETKQLLEAKNTHQDSLNKVISENETKISKLEEQVRHTRDAMEKYARDYEALKNDSIKLKSEKEEEATKNYQLVQDYRKSQQTINEKIMELNKQEQNSKSLRRQLDQQLKENTGLVDDIKSLKAELDSSKNSITQLNNELDDMKRNLEFLEKDRAIVERERERIKQSLSKQEAATKSEETKVLQTESEIRAIENELSNFKREVVLLESSIKALEREREKFGTELSAEHQKYIAVTEELKMKEVLEAELNKKIGEGEAKLKQQQQLYEAVRADRNLYSKNLMEAQDEIAELKRKFKIMTHQIEQLKEEISVKDSALVREQLGRKKAEKLQEHTKQELTKRQSLLEEAEKTLNKQHQEISKLTRCISTMDEDALRQRKEYDQVVNERDILGTQLIRRNDELALLYEKIKILQLTIKKGSKQYEDRLGDITALRLKIQDLIRELSIHTRKTNQMNVMKTEIFQLQRELLQEKTKVKALSEELENPMNVHRWRKLEGSDPATYEMIQKIQTLQKRLIVKTEQVVEKDLVIKEKEKLYEELKGVLARQPGPEVLEQLNVYQHNLKEKSRQMKVLAAELNMSQSQVNEYKYEIEKINHDLQEIKRKYYEMKNKEMHIKDTQMYTDPMGISSGTAMYPRPIYQSNTLPPPRFTGGGFNLNVRK